MRLYWPTELRPAFDALLAIDDALGEVVANSTQPALGAIRLTWWRDALERLDTGPPPPEPRLQAVAMHLLPRGVRGAELAQIAEGWAALFEEDRDSERIAARGAALFAVGARLLGSDDAQLAEAGRYFGLADAARRGLTPLLAIRIGPHRFGRAVRPLTALARLAVRDLRKGEPFEQEATPGRAAALLLHRLSGKLG